MKIKLSKSKKNSTNKINKRKLNIFKKEEKEISKLILFMKYLTILFTSVVIFFLFKFAFGFDLFEAISENNYIGSGHLNLLAVSEGTNGMSGSIADLYLEVREGDGSIYIDTFPLTKLDTQISNRFAKEVACNYLDLYCDNLNFYYRIRSNSAMIGGPSAGAAATALTIAVLLGYDIDESVAITGTINSGGMIGVVGGVKEKIDAASASGLRKVLISSSDTFEIEETIDEKNVTIDLTDYAKSINITLIKVDTIDDVLYHMTNGKIASKNEKVEINDYKYLDEYSKIMKTINSGLCNRTSELEKESSLIKNKSNATKDNLLRGKNFTIDSINERESGNLYSSASFCFSANNIYQYEIIKSKNFSTKELKDLLTQGRDDVFSRNFKVEKEEISTITKFQAYLIVKQRLNEADDYFVNGLNSLNETDNDLSKRELSKGIERYFSVILWENFLNMTGEEFIIDDFTMQNSCNKKIAEAEEKMRYASLFFSYGLTDINEMVINAKEYKNKGNYKFCLFEASIAKANTENIISLLALSSGNISTFIEKKSKITENRINENMNNGIFPILGYSYFEYSKSLHNLEDYYLSSTYLEYALELSNFDMYFRKEDSQKKYILSVVKYYVYAFTIIAFLFGIIFGMFVVGNRRSKIKDRNEGSLTIKLKR